MVKLSAIVGR